MLLANTVDILELKYDECGKWIFKSRFFDISVDGLEIKVKKKLELKSVKIHRDVLKMYSMIIKQLSNKKRNWLAHMTYQIVLAIEVVDDVTKIYAGTDAKKLCLRQMSLYNNIGDL